MAGMNEFPFSYLDKSNYFTWKFRMEHYLKAEKLWAVIIEDKPALAIDSSNKALVEKWSEDDEQALARIGLSIDDSQIMHVRTAKTAKKAWNALKGYHERDTLTNRIYILRRIRDSKLQEGGNIEQHINEMTVMFHKLAVFGDKMDEFWKMALLLNSLPPSYDTLVTALELRDENDLTLSMVQEKLISEYKMRREGQAETRFKTTNKVTSECFFCKKIGHFKKDCIKYKKWKESQKKSQNSSAKSSWNIF